MDRQTDRQTDRKTDAHSHTVTVPVAYNLSHLVRSSSNFSDGLGREVTSSSPVKIMSYVVRVCVCVCMYVMDSV